MRAAKRNESLTSWLRHRWRLVLAAIGVLALLAQVLRSMAAVMGPGPKSAVAIVVFLLLYVLMIYWFARPRIIARRTHSWQELDAKIDPADDSDVTLHLVWVQFAMARREILGRPSDPSECESEAFQLHRGMPIASAPSAYAVAGFIVLVALSSVALGVHMYATSPDDPVSLYLLIFFGLVAAALVAVARLIVLRLKTPEAAIVRKIYSSRSASPELRRSLLLEAAREHVELEQRGRGDSDLPNKRIEQNARM